jgi:hypothetical protein
LLVICGPHHARESLSPMVLDEMVTDLVHQAIEQHELGECLARPIDAGGGEARLHDRAAVLQSLARALGKVTAYEPRWLGLLVQQDPAGNDEPGQCKPSVLVRIRLAEFD